MAFSVTNHGPLELTGTFQRLMDMVLRGLTWASVLVYIDDIVVYAHSHADLKLVI